MPDEVAPYVAEFESLARQYGRYSEIAPRMYKLTIAYGNPVGKAVASCDASSGSVVIDQAKWSKQIDDVKRVVIYHELGHCILHRRHNDTVFSGRPVSIMYESSVAGYFYNQYKDEYNEELFQ